MAKKKKQSGIGAGTIVLVALVGLLGGKDKSEAKPSEWHYNTTSQTVAAATRAPTKAVTEAAAETQYVQLQSGNLTERKKTQTQLREEYATLIFGIAVFLAANLFNLSPAITGIVLSGYSQRRNTAGDVQDDYLLSVRFTRAPFEQLCAGDNDPIEFCQRFENRCKMTATKIFKPIDPYAD